VSAAVTNLTVRYGETTALDDVTMEVPAGQISAVVGGDGAGKTTLMRALVGRVPPSHGRVSAPPEREIGYQPASSGTWPDLTVEENLAFVGGMYGLTAAARERRRDELLDRAGLTAARDRLASRLSGGMRTKLGFCMALIHDPSLLVLDEPSTGVDPVSRVELWRLLAESAASGTAVVLATTYMDEGERAAHVTVLDRGRALLAGPPADVVSSFPGAVVTTDRPVRPEMSWRHADGYREWWPDGTVPTGHTVDVDLEDVTIVAALHTENGVSA
jgi:ABC-2 type transport system ATP-binding protein